MTKNRKRRASAKHPLVSMVVFAYNQERVVEQAIQSAMAQTYSPLEILLSDDASTDDTFQIMERAAAAYSGPHDIKLNRNAQNLGAIGHVNRIFELAQGALIVVNAGDDISKEDRVEKLTEAFIAHDRPLMLHSAVEKITEDGQSTGEIWNRGAEIAQMTKRRAAVERALCIGASSAWNPDIMQKYGPITEKHAYGDLIFSFRAKLWDSLVHVDEPLVQYRLGGFSTVRSTSPEEQALRHWKRERTQLAVLTQRLADIRKGRPSAQALINFLEGKIAEKRREFEGLPRPDRQAG